LYESSQRFSVDDHVAEYFEAGHLKEAEEIAVPPTGALPNVQPGFFGNPIVLFSVSTVFVIKSCGWRIKFVGAWRLPSREYIEAGSRSALIFSRFASFIFG
jgi:hypothetical protein